MKKNSAPTSVKSLFIFIYLQTPQTSKGIDSIMESQPSTTMKGRSTYPTMPILPPKRPMPVRRKESRVRSLAMAVRPNERAFVGLCFIALDISSNFISDIFIIHSYIILQQPGLWIISDPDEALRSKRAFLIVFIEKRVSRYREFFLPSLGPIFERLLSHKECGLRLRATDPLSLPEETVW